ncbi:phage integrase N-terminal SAM-like domain-containing protein [Fictibacillus sp. 18YEL24]|uniref:phage integrase N-terminal SAM-like domain-containing protein n=1 Tax=Fictibacillus sp. 18YEL24 TaxID=2745875 RepID=UPI001E3D0A0B|nr:phage integrase N-terminal SAM-like domain-containing protein [Fictibacillus sp. 18YEL24]
MNGIQKYWESRNENLSEETRSVLNEYLLSLRLANKAEATIKKYLWILEKFLSGTSIYIKDLTSANVLDWLNTFSENKSPKTINFLSFFLL